MIVVSFLFGVIVGYYVLNDISRAVQKRKNHDSERGEL